MLTEYSSYDDIRKFRDKVHIKFKEMEKGWLGREIKRAMIKWRQSKLSKGQFSNLKRSFKVDNHLVELIIYPGEFMKTERIDKHGFYASLSVEVETKRGKLCYELSTREIHIYTPHYIKRHKERFNCQFKSDAANQKIVPYVRNGKNYILMTCNDNSVMIARKLADDIIMYITFLHRDMCTGKNYQELFERAGKAIDEQDIYEWK